MKTITLNLVWEKGVMKEDLFDFEKGKKVLIAANPFKHRGLGTTWFIFDGYTSYQATEEYGGKRLCQLVTTRGRYGDQVEATKRFKHFYARWHSNLQSTPRSSVFSKAARGLRFST